MVTSAARVRDAVVRAAVIWKRWLRPVLKAVSPLGWAVAAAAAALGAAGALWGWQEASAAAVLAAALFVLAVAFVLGRSSYAVSLDLARSRVAVGDSAVGSVEVVNTAARPVLPSLLELPVGAATAVFHLPRLRPGVPHEDLFTIPTQRRAVIVVGPVRSVRADPVGLLRREVMWTEPEDLYVHPRTTVLGTSAAGFIRDLEGQPTNELATSDVSFHALREYVPGDDRRHIHWKTTARTGTLMVRQFEETRRAHLAVCLSVNLDEYGGEEEFELAVSVAGSIGRQAVAEQRELSAITQRGPLRTESARHFLDDLTRLQGASLRAGAVDAARLTADAVPNASVVILVLGSLVRPAQLRAAAAMVPVGIRSVAVRCEEGAAPGKASIGDLTVLTVGSLEDLGPVLRKAAA
ncbi:DUF58 domain-containing protein [Sinomonas halotolerans]|uniref:DUF58 domain-containing protein n=1 Tax=Sinomonas halotolerans TaxID=1644133 RepID=A0ABU9WWQ8_9MICC